MKKIPLQKTRNTEKILNTTFVVGKFYKVNFKIHSNFYEKEFSGRPKENTFGENDKTIYIVEIDNTVNLSTDRFRWGKVSFLCNGMIYYSDLEYFIGSILNDYVEEI